METRAPGFWPIPRIRHGGILGDTVRNLMHNWQLKCGSGLWSGCSNRPGARSSVAPKATCCAWELEPSNYSPNDHFERNIMRNPWSLCIPILRQTQVACWVRSKPLESAGSFRQEEDHLGRFAHRASSCFREDPRWSDAEAPHLGFWAVRCQMGLGVLFVVKCCQ